MSAPGDAYQQLVASIVRALESDAAVDEGGWIEGPDGERDMDVTVRGKLAGTDAFVFVECKDWHRSVGIQVVDALDSKRRDLGATHAIVCSNSGFSAQALRKAARIGIGTVSAVMQGDGRVRITVETEVYCGRVRPGTVQCTYHGEDLPSLPRGITDRQVLHGGRPLAAWFRDRLSWFVLQYPTSSALQIHTEFREPLSLSFAGAVRRVTGFRLRVDYSTAWYVRTVSVDASAGLYDYLTNTMSIEPTGKYHISDMSYDLDADARWQRVDFVPQSVLGLARLARGGQPQRPPPLLGMEVQATFYVLEGIDTVDNAPAPDLAPLVATERVEPD